MYVPILFWGYTYFLSPSPQWEWLLKVDREDGERDRFVASFVQRPLSRRAKGKGRRCGKISIFVVMSTTKKEQLAIPMEQKNYCIIMSGGIGSRFWPVSRAKKPKQFLDFFGFGKTLLQSTFERFSSFIPEENVIVVTNEQYAEETRRQLPKLREENLLLEPVRRNTAPCIAYAAYKIQKRCPDASIFVTPSDHIVIDEVRFGVLAKEALDFVRHNDYLVTLGVMASRPETGYGYIQWSDETVKGFHKVKVFTEKPTLEMAELFVESGDFLWNSGMFVWNVPTICHAIKSHLVDIYDLLKPETAPYDEPSELAFIEKVFPTCPSISIDYGLMEKANNVLVLPSDFGWADLGTWSSVYEMAPKEDDEGNTATPDNCFFHEAKGNIVTLSLPEKVAVIQGIDDCIVADHGNVLLICKKDQEIRIKSFMTEVELKYGKEYI